MCLSNIYLEEKKEDKLFVEEADQVIVNNDYIQITSFINENKNLEGYYISEVDFINNHVILQKKQREINKMHKQYNEDINKLEKGLPYLLKHNQDHLNDIRKWIQRAKKADQNEIAEDLFDEPQNDKTLHYRLNNF